MADTALTHGRDYGPHFAVGDRVLRRRFSDDVGGRVDFGRVRVGEVVDVRRDAPSSTSRVVYLYSVRWDDQPGTIEHGYLATGLEKAPLSIGGLGT